jgi:hypothetical protein
MHRIRIALAVVPAALSLVGLSVVAVAPTLAASCGSNSPTLQDGGFEAPVIDPSSFSQLDASLVPPWQTTDSQNEIEIWSTGFRGVPSDEGNQFAELNANSPGTLYQDVVTTPGDMMTWTLEHRGRLGSDTMKVLIGDAATADVTSDTGWNFISGDLTDDTSGWGLHTAPYVVPAGQTCTRFAFRAVSAAGGNPSIGNFLDAVAFQIATPPSPSPSPSMSPNPSGGVEPTIQATPPVTTMAGPAGGSSPGALVLLAVLAGASGFVLGLRRAIRKTPPAH